MYNPVDYDDLIVQLSLAYPRVDKLYGPQVLAFVEENVGDCDPRNRFGMTVDDITEDLMITLEDRALEAKEFEKISALIDAASILDDIPDNFKIGGLRDKVDTKAWTVIVKKIPGACSFIHTSSKKLKKKIDFVADSMKRYKAFMKSDDVQRAQEVAIEILAMALGLPPGTSVLAKMASKFQEAMGKMILKALKWLLKRKDKGETSGFATVCKENVKPRPKKSGR